MTHEDIWKGIDALAAAHKLSPSGLARRAGLDATAFNPSKRVGRDGRARWPSTESVARALKAVGMSFGEFASVIEHQTDHMFVPVIGFAEAGLEGFFDDRGLPTGDGWGQISIPAPRGLPVYALEVSGHSMMPAYRPGDRIIVSPRSEISIGDRVVVRTRTGEVVVKVLGEWTEDRVVLDSVNPDYTPRKLSPNDVMWIARIHWVSQ